ncbi:hypothetical protein EDB86DRAFT_1958835 [Lactarius hatsudake]|nr:hypothetical protein EDB86DRAFT_1958835 [Lactarius hatsudake]
MITYILRLGFDYLPPLALWIAIVLVHYTYVCCFLVVACENTCRWHMVQFNLRHVKVTTAIPENDLIPSLVLFFLPFLSRHISCLVPPLRLIPKGASPSSHFGPSCPPPPPPILVKIRTRAYSSQSKHSVICAMRPSSAPQPYILPVSAVRTFLTVSCPTPPHHFPSSHSTHSRALCGLFIQFPIHD